MAAGLALWPWISDSLPALTLFMLASLLGMVHWHLSCGARAAPAIQALARSASGQWFVLAADGRAAPGRIERIWYGPFWSTVRLRPHDGASDHTVTVWRSHVSESAWHRLRAALARETALASHLRRRQP